MTHYCQWKIFTSVIQTSMFWIQWTPGKHFIHSVGCGSGFPEKKKVVEMFEEVKINRVDEAKLDSSIHSTFGALLLCQAVWRAGEMSSLCWSILAAGLAVLELLCTLIGCNVVSPGFKRLLLTRPAVNHTNQRPWRCFCSGLFFAGLRLTSGKCSVVSSSNTELAIPSYPT